MSGLEVLGVVASVLQIADVGARLSVKLCTFSHKVKYANSNIRNISSDVALTCSVLRELGDNLKKDEQSRLCNNKAVETAESVINECMKVFTELEGAIDKKAIDCDEKKNVFKRVGKGVKFSFIEPQVELLRTNLERLKSTLLLMLNVIIYAGQLRSKAKTEVLQEQQELIKTLNEEKKNNDRKFDQLTKAIEGLGISQDEDKGLQKVDFDDTIHSSQLASSKSSITCLQRASPSNSIYINMVQVQDLNVDIQPFSKKLKMKQSRKEEPLRFTLPHPLESSEELSHYCFLLKHLLSEIEAVQWKLDQEVRTSFREEIIRSHNRTADILTAKHGHERIYRIFNQALGDKVAQSSTLSSGSVEDLRLKNAIRLAELGLLPKTVLSAMQNGSDEPKILGRGQIIDSLAEEVWYRPPEVSSLIQRVYSLATPEIAMNPVHCAGPPALGHGPSNLFGGIMANPVEQRHLAVSPKPVQQFQQFPPRNYQQVQAPVQQQQSTMAAMNYLWQDTTLVSDVERAARQVPMSSTTSYEPISTPAPASQSTSSHLTGSGPASFKGNALKRKNVKGLALSAPPTKPFKLPEESWELPPKKRRNPGAVTVDLSKVAAERTSSRSPSQKPLQTSHNFYTMDFGDLTDATRDEQIPPTTAHEDKDTLYSFAAAPVFNNAARRPYSRGMLKRTVPSDETNLNPEDIAIAGAIDTDLHQEEIAIPGAASDTMAFTPPILPTVPPEIQDFTADYVVPSEYFTPLMSPALAASNSVYIPQVPDINEVSKRGSPPRNDPAETLEVVGPMEACVNCQMVGVQCDARKPICHHCREKVLWCIYRESPLVVNARSRIYGAPVERLFSKRTSHKVSEQGRRNRINIALKEIEDLLPPHHTLVPIPPSRRDTGDAQNNMIPLSDEGKEINLGAERPDNEGNTQDVNMTAALPQANSKARTVEMAAEYIKSLQAELASAKARLADQNLEPYELQKRVGTDGTETAEHQVGEGIAMRRLRDQSILSVSHNSPKTPLAAFPSEFDDENHRGHLERRRPDFRSEGAGRPANRPWSVEEGIVPPEILADISAEFMDPLISEMEEAIETTMSTSSEEEDVSSDSVASKASFHVPISRPQADLTQATNEATLAATYMNWDFCSMKAEAPKEYQASGDYLQRLDRSLDLVDDLLLQWTTWDRSTLDVLNRDAGMGDIGAAP